jgi:hypothetical protein
MDVLGEYAHDKHQKPTTPVNLSLVKRAVDELKELDTAMLATTTGAKVPLFIRLVQSPDAWDASRWPSDELQWSPMNEEQVAEVQANRFALQASQKEALESSLSHHLQLLWYVVYVN